MRYAVARVVLSLAAVIVAGCYLYSPDITLDSRVKLDPADYICGATSAHPWATLKEATPSFHKNVQTCLAALNTQGRDLQGQNDLHLDSGELDPILLVPHDPTPNPRLDAFGVPAAETFRNNEQLRSAIAYAEYARDEYMAAKRQGGAIPPFLATVLAPIGGTALALGSLGISSLAVTSLGAAAGTIAGGASVVQSKDREKIYVIGAEGVQCLLNNMQPYTYVDREKLRELYVLLQILAVDRLQVDTLIGAVQAERQLPPCPKKTDPFLKKRADLLTAAQEADKAATTTDDVGYTFLRTTHDSPATIVYTVDRINNNVSDSIINTEADVQTLAQNLQKVIKTEEQTILQSIPNAKSAAKQASTDTPPPSSSATSTPPQKIVTKVKKTDSSTTTTTTTTTVQPSTTEEGSPVKISAPPDTVKAPEFKQPYNPSEETYSSDAQLSEAVLNLAYDAGRILDIVGSNLKPPKNDACTTIEKKSGVAKVLTFVPDGDIIVKQGSHTDLTVAGAQYPYVRPLFGEDQPTVTATLKEDSVLEIAASPDAEYGDYPFFVGDGPTGKPVTAVILYKKNACAETALPPRGGAGGHHRGATKTPPAKTPKTPTATSTSAWTKPPSHQ
jgi:hypothetical protein